MLNRYWHDLADRLLDRLPVLQHQVETHIQATYATEGRGCVVVLRYTDPAVPTWIGYTTPTQYPPVLAAVMPNVLQIVNSYDPTTTYVVVQAEVGADARPLHAAQIQVYPFHAAMLQIEGQ